MARKLTSWWLEAQTLASFGFVFGAVWRLPGMIRRARVSWETLLPVDLPPATVIVPARNEQANIERCVKSLLAQDYPDYEVIAVDDGSEDATPQMLDKLRQEHPQLKVVRLDGNLPPDWAGKPHAIQQGYAEACADSQWLLLTDADTYHDPQALRRVVTLGIQQQLDLLSLFPHQELKTFWEKVLLPFISLGILMQYPLDTINRPDKKVALANGQFMLLRRTAFDRVGGYGGSLKNSLLDDRDMALAVKSSGGKMLLTDGAALMSVRMYTGLGQIWRGFVKNSFVGSRTPYLSVPFLVASGLTLEVLPVGQLLWGLVGWISSGGKRHRKLLAYSALQIGLGTVARRRFDRELGLPAVYSLTSPLAMLVFSGVLTESMVRSLLGRGVAWKGRSYVGAARTQQLIK